jgi:hypothetical protein
MDLTNKQGFKQVEMDLQNLLNDLGAQIRSLYYFTDQLQSELIKGSRVTSELVTERDRAIALLKEIATMPTKERRPDRHSYDVIVSCEITLESIQRHVRQKLEEWGIKEGSNE